MYYLIFLTERCNLECTYCETKTSRSERVQEIQYDLDTLIDFLRADANLGLQFYGGEPLLRIDLIKEILSRTDPVHTCLQTNGFLLDKVPDEVMKKIDVFCVSLDGPSRLTDKMRGDGVYARAVDQSKKLRARGYTGDIDVRMTTSPGVQIYDAVNHFLGECEFDFDSIYWQLNVLFGELDWRWDRKFIKRWFRDAYNPQITRLIDEWIADMKQHGRIRKIIPFAGVLNTIMSGEPVPEIHCGAGAHSWTITPDGGIYVCPVLRESPEFSVGNISSTRPSEIVPMCDLQHGCDGCEVRDVCGGRCIYASEAGRWGDEGFNLVCDSVKHMIAELRRVAPDVQKLVDDGRIDLADYADVGFDYEVIP